MRSLGGLVNVAQTRCRPPGVGDSVPLSRPRRKAAKRCRASMTRPAWSQRASWHRVDKGPRGGVEVSCFLVGLHFSLPLFCFLVLNKRSALTNTMSSIFTKKRPQRVVIFAPRPLATLSSCKEELQSGTKPRPLGANWVFSSCTSAARQAHSHIYFPRRLCAASRACRSDVYLSFSSSVGALKSVVESAVCPINLVTRGRKTVSRECNKISKKAARD